MIIYNSEILRIDVQPKMCLKIYYTQFFCIKKRLQIYFLKVKPYQHFQKRIVPTLLSLKLKILLLLYYILYNISMYINIIYFQNIYKFFKYVPFYCPCPLMTFPQIFLVIRTFPAT